MEPYVHAREGDSARRAENEEGQASTLGRGGPLVLALQILKGIDGQDQLGDGEREHGAEEDAEYRVSCNSTGMEEDRHGISQVSFPRLSRADGFSESRVIVAYKAV